MPFTPHPDLHGLVLPGFGPIEEAGADSVEFSGLALRDGAWRLGRLLLRGVRLRTPGLALQAGELLLRGLTLQPAAPGTPGAFEALALDELQAQALTLELAQTPSPAAAGDSAHWQLDALAGAEGGLQMHIDDAAWIMDADVAVPVHGGRIDFNGLSVAHIGPDSPMGVSRMGVYADSPAGRNYLFQFALPHVPGARFEQRGSLFGARVTDRGGLELKPFVESLLHNAGCGTPLGRPGADAAPALQRTRLSGALQLGEGVLGTALQHLALERRSPGGNRVELSAAVLGRQLTLRLPELQAAQARLSLPGLEAGSGPLAAALSLVLSAPGTGAALRVAVQQLQWQGLRAERRGA